MSTYTFLWHDYETFGVQPRRDRPAQFAAIRTDAELNEISEPLILYCNQATDFLPNPGSCLITGITPQLCLERGIPEFQFAAQIEKAFSEPGTIGVGYNVTHFDDEVTRFLFWRNLIDPYAREWQNNCGRWDILDVIRTAYALRPDGIRWPTNDQGRPSFRLDHLTAANGLNHAAAHDALSDARATIGLARLIRQHQPKMFDFCLALHKKDRVGTEIGLPTPRPFLHISSMFPAERGCIGVMWPLGVHPTNKNEILVWDLAYDPSELFSMNAETVRTRLFRKTDALPEGMTRLPLKSLHMNKSPIVINKLQTLSRDMAARWGLDIELALRHAEIAARAPDLSELWGQVYERAEKSGVDVDEDLYGGFVGKDDRRKLNELLALPPQKLANAAISFDDRRLEELTFRYRARNFPDTLSEEDAQRWDAHRAARLFNGDGNARTIEMLFEEIKKLSETANQRGKEILGALSDYAEMIAPPRD